MARHQWVKRSRPISCSVRIGWGPGSGADWRTRGLGGNVTVPWNWKSTPTAHPLHCPLIAVNVRATTCYWWGSEISVWGRQCRMALGQLTLYGPGTMDPALGSEPWPCRMALDSEPWPCRMALGQWTMTMSYGPGTVNLESKEGLVSSCMPPDLQLLYNSMLAKDTGVRP